MTRVVAAVIERGGRILICQRRRDHTHALKWEFPGGKLEVGETPEEALRRELQEELNIDAVIGGEITRYAYTYPGRSPILLIFFAVTEFAGEMENRVFEQMVWEEARNLTSYDFLEGDVDFVSSISARTRQ